MNILFDLDGTLTDPGPGFVKSIRYALDELKIDPPSDMEIAAHIGPPLEETLSRLLGPANVQHIPDAIRLYRERYSTVGLYENSIYEGIREALEKMLNSGSRIFLATSKPSVFAIRIIEYFELSLFFSGIYGSALDGTYADKRLLLAHLLERESLNAAESVMVGDRSHDVRGALANGINPVGVLWGYGTAKELMDAGANKLIHTPNELPEALFNNRN